MSPAVWPANGVSSCNRCSSTAATISPISASTSPRRPPPPPPSAGGGAARIDDLRDRGERGARAAEPAGLAPLGDEHVDALLGSPAGLLDCVDLLHEEAAGSVNPL